MKIFKVLAVLFLSAFALTSANASEDKIFFTDKAKCESAVSSGEAMFYSPSLKRPAPTNWKRETLKASTCVQMETTQGMQWVVLPPGFKMAQKPDTKAWHAEDCTNWTNWLPGNKLSEPIATQTPGVVQAVAGNTILQGLVCDAKCQQVKICGENGLTPLDKMNEKGEWLCQAPDYKILVIQSGSIRGEVLLEQKGWTVSGNGTLPPATMNFNLEKPNVSVSGRVCSPQGCQTRESAKVVEWRPATETTLKFCALRTDKGEIVGIFNHNGFVQVVKMTKENVKPDGTPDFSNKPKAYTFTSQPVSRLDNGDCKTVTNTIVAHGWAAVVEKLDLEKSCKVISREWRGAENQTTVRR